jgi:hypothetical protein
MVFVKAPRACFLLVPCMAYSLTLKTEAVRSSETSADFYQDYMALQPRQQYFISCQDLYYALWCSRSWPWRVIYSVTWRQKEAASRDLKYFAGIFVDGLRNTTKILNMDRSRFKQGTSQIQVTSYYLNQLLRSILWFGFVCSVFFQNRSVLPNPKFWEQYGLKSITWVECR